MNSSNKKINTSAEIMAEELYTYRIELESCMKKMGATESDMALIHDNTIINSISRNRKPEDVAWAILQ